MSVLDSNLSGHEFQITVFRVAVSAVVHTFYGIDNVLLRHNHDAVVIGQRLHHVARVAVPIETQRLLQVLSPRVGAGENDDSIPFLLIFEEIPRKHLKAAVVGAHSLDSGAKARSDIPSPPAELEHRKSYAAPVVQRGDHFVRAFDLRDLISLFIIALSDPVLNTLAEFCLHRPGGVRDVRGFVDEDGGCICTFLRFGNPVHKSSETTDVIVGGVDQDMPKLLDRPL